MVASRTGMIIAFLILLSPLTASPVAQVIGLTSKSTQVTTDASTQAYTGTLVHTYFGSTTGMTVAQTAVSFPERIVGFVAPKGKCALYSLPVMVSSGTLLNVEMTANYPVNFFILSEFPSGGLTGCNVLGNPLVAQANFTEFTLHWTAPENGIFYFVFTGPTAIILLSDHGSVKPVEEVTTITYPTSIRTELSTYSEIATLASTVTVTSPLYLQTTTQNWLLIVGSIIVAVAITLSLLAFIRRPH